jgi:accessory gene regulator protein AgrB
MKQSRLMSLVESLANVLVGYGVAVATQMLVFPLFGLAVTFSENLLIGLIFTVVSIVRSYALRRSFEALRVRQSAMASSTISQ